jgi:cobyrinic acid a,c-diamide synthase
MAALTRRGVAVAAAKVGPDFIDPGYHALATGCPPRNLDAWICGGEAVPGLMLRAGAGSEILVVEGVMGLFDGAGADATASTAAVALATQTPVVLVVDAAAMSGSVAALVHGFRTFDPWVDVAGVVLNRVAGERHEALLRAALAPSGLPVLGALPRDPALTWRDRHLGLVPVVEARASVRRSLDRLADVVDAHLDLDAIIRVARRAPEIAATPPAPARRVGAARVAVAGGSAFSFLYTDTVERLAEAGADVLHFDPLVDPTLPDDVDGLVVGGGFPEVHAEPLAANETLRADVAARVAAGLVTWAECGGLLWLARRLDDQPMCGVLAADGRMADRLTLGYRVATARIGTPVAPTGTVLRGHEFHYSTLEPAGTALELDAGGDRRWEGHGSPTMLATYLHLHLGADPAPAERFVAAAARHRLQRHAAAVP